MLPSVTAVEPALPRSQPPVRQRLRSARSVQTLRHQQVVYELDRSQRNVLYVYI